MKKTIFLFLMAFAIFQTMAGQSPEKFIRIIGNSSKDIMSNKIRVTLTISEVKANGYNQKEDISFDTVHKETLSQLSGIGIPREALKKQLGGPARYNNINSVIYLVETDIKNLEKISNINQLGFTYTDVTYLFPESGADQEIELSKQAISDAQRKAKAICKDINKKAGDILNIEVREGDFSTRTRENRTNSMSLSYKVSVTFKLVD